MYVDRVGAIALVCLKVPAANAAAEGLAYFKA
jgi:hypothetical protein